jgi:iduronate 2-sulfatase
VSIDAPFTAARGAAFVARGAGLVAMMAGILATAAAAEPYGSPGLNRRLVVRGLGETDPDTLARSLLASDDLLLLSGPRTSRKVFLAAVAEKATLVLQRDGFPEARATARVEADAGEERVVVEAVEGPRIVAAGIEIHGLPHDLREELRQWLKSPRPPPGSIPQRNESDGGWVGTRWLDERGQPARMEPRLWRIGQPAPCDPIHLRAVREAIGRFFRDHGYYAAARVTEEQGRPRSGGVGPDPAAPAVDVAVRRDASGAVLDIDVRNLPPASVLRGVYVPPASGVSAADLEKAFGVSVGRVVTERDRLAWREELRLSGRFVHQDVRFKELPAAAAGPGIEAIFALDAYPGIEPLPAQLSRADRVALRFRHWLLSTLADEVDLVVEWTPPSNAAGDEPGQPIGSLVVSTRDGVLLTSLPGSPDACGVAVSDAGLGFFLARDAGWFEIPLPWRKRFTADCVLSLAETIEEGRHRYHRRFATSWALQPRPRGSAALAVTARIEPVVCLAFVREGDPRLSWEGDELVVTRPEVTARFDERTGRLTSLEVPGAGRLTVEAAAGRLAADVTALRTAAGTDRTRRDAFVTSGIEFLAGDAMRRTIDGLVGAVGLSAATRDWRERLEALADQLRRTASAGGFTAADESVGRVIGRAVDEAAMPTLVLPGEEPVWTDEDAATVVQRAAAAEAWRWADMVCGRDAWPTALARVAALATRRDMAVLWELSAYTGGMRNGPLAMLAAATVMPAPAMAASLARQGLDRLTDEAFHGDCQPVLAMLASCGIDRCAAALLRVTDDDEARMLGERIFGEPTFLVPLVAGLRDRESDAAAVAALPDVLDRWWRESLRPVVQAGLAAFAGAETASRDVRPSDRPNVLLVCVDDLKPVLGCYGDELARTPALDRLAARGVRFERAYCNEATCSPSRNALLTGLRPQSIGVYDLATNFRVGAADAVTLGQHFKRHGYRTESLGKIFHTAHGNTDDAASWSVPSWRSRLPNYAIREHDRDPQAGEGAQGDAWESADVADDRYADGQTADTAIQRLRDAKERGEPFLLAVGFLRPHLPFVAPRRYWDLHRRESFLPASIQVPPVAAPAYAPQFGNELRKYRGIPADGSLAENLQRTLIHGYYAATSYVDAQIGRVLDELDRLGLAEDTIVVVWGDHGWHLGDHGMWCKHTNYEQAARIPLIVVAPGRASAARADCLVESVDVYPTLADLAGLPVPAGLDGRSFAKVLDDPSAKHRDHVVHVFPRNDPARGAVLGRAVRTDRHRLVEWKAIGAATGTAEHELYDYDRDPLETRNLVGEQAETAAALKAVLATHPEPKPQVNAAGGREH